LIARAKELGWEPISAETHSALAVLTFRQSEHGKSVDTDG
jgi:hypothetical protein